MVLELVDHRLPQKNPTSLKSGSKTISKLSLDSSAGELLVKQLLHSQELSIIAGVLNFLKKVVTAAAGHVWIFQSLLAILIGYTIYQHIKSSDRYWFFSRVPTLLILTSKHTSNHYHQIAKRRIEPIANTRAWTSSWWWPSVRWDTHRLLCYRRSSRFRASWSHDSSSWSTATSCCVRTRRGLLYQIYQKK